MARTEGSVYRVPAPPKPPTTSKKSTRDIAPKRTTTLPTYVAPAPTSGGPIIDPLLGTLGLILNDPSNPTIPLPDYRPPGSGGGTGGGGGGGGGTGGGGGAGGTTTTPGTGDLDPSIYTALLPFLSPEDRERLLSTLAIQGIPAIPPTLEPGALQSQVEGLSVIPGELKSETRDTFLGSQRAASVASALSNFATAQGKTAEQLGPGYRFLTEVANNLKRFSNQQGPMSRSQYVQFREQINPLLEQGGKYGELGRMLALPFFSTGNLFNVAKDRSGQYLFGDANKRLFR